MLRQLKFEFERFKSVHYFDACEALKRLVDLLGLTVRVLELGLALNKARHGSEVVAGDTACSVRSSEHLCRFPIILSDVSFFLRFLVLQKQKMEFY